jgi:protease-4
MKDFVKFVFASCLGMTIAGVLLFSFGSAMVTRSISAFSEDSAPVVKSNSVLNISLNAPIPEKTNNVQVDRFDIETGSILGLHDMVRAIRHAASDDDIQGVMIDLSGVGLGQANTSYLRNEILDFKKSGKFVLAYAQMYSRGTYYVASAADKIYINPFSIMEFDGFAATIPFFKGLLDKMGVKMQVRYAGQFKSATEPFRLFKMSEQNRTQVREYLEGMYKVYLEDIAATRNMTHAQ